MSELSIKVNIGSRTYPLTIKREEEETIRKAAKMINENIEHLESNYSVRDKQDLLAMTVLQYATKYLNSAQHVAVEGPELGQLQEINAALDQYLEKVAGS